MLERDSSGAAKRVSPPQRYVSAAVLLFPGGSILRRTTKVTMPAILNPFQSVVCHATHESYRTRLLVGDLRLEQLAKRVRLLIAPRLVYSNR